MSTPSTDPTTAVPAGPEAEQVALETLRAVGDQVATLVHSLGETSWRVATPCPDLDVAHLVAHLVGGLEAFTAVARGEGVPDVVEPDLASGEASHRYREALDDAVDAWSAPGRLADSYDMPWGTTTGRMLVGFLLVEQAAHGWDLARALGIRGMPDGSAVVLAEAVAREMVSPQMRIPSMFGPEVPAPDHAAPIDRLAAFLGRRP